MAIRKIARMGHETLKKVSEPIPDPTAPEIARLAQDLIDTCEDIGGNGIAAPQVYEPVRMFAYRVRIENHGYETVQLLKRHWIITDGDGQVRHVEGEGVVGEQPVLKPGESFEYTSGCPLSTPVGTMRGSYQMQTVNRALLQVEIPEFTLAVPSAIN